MTRIKICGIKTEEQALAAAEAGAEYIGLVFVQSPRQVTPIQAKKIATAVKGEKGNAPETVGVFVNAPADIVNKITELCGLDYVQLSGDETMDYCRGLNRPVFKAIRIGLHHHYEQVLKDMTGWNNVLADRKNVFLLDTYDTGKYGGTGKLLDRDTAGLLAKQFQVIIAGGLDPENVGGLISKIRPWGVDVSSGVETEGEKDMQKIRAFIKAVRDADAKQA